MELRSATAPPTPTRTERPHRGLLRPTCAGHGHGVGVGICTNVSQIRSRHYSNARADSTSAVEHVLIRAGTGQ